MVRSMSHIPGWGTTQTFHVDHASETAGRTGGGMGGRGGTACTWVGTRAGGMCDTQGGGRLRGWNCVCRRTCSQPSLDILLLPPPQRDSDVVIRVVRTMHSMVGVGVCTRTLAHAFLANWLVSGSGPLTGRHRSLAASSRRLSITPLEGPARAGRGARRGSGFAGGGGVGVGRQETTWAATNVAGTWPTTHMATTLASAGFL